MQSRERLHSLVAIATLGSLALTQGGWAPDHAPATSALIGPDDPDIQAALKARKDTGQAPIIRKDEFIQYPYGLTEAVVTCQPLHVCDIELEAGKR